MVLLRNHPQAVSRFHMGLKNMDESMIWPWQLSSSTCLCTMENESRSTEQILVFSGLLTMVTKDEQWLFPLTSLTSLQALTSPPPIYANCPPLTALCLPPTLPLSILIIGTSLSQTQEPYALLKLPGSNWWILLTSACSSQGTSIMNKSSMETLWTLRMWSWLHQMLIYSWSTTRELFNGNNNILVFPLIPE